MRIAVCADLHGELGSKMSGTTSNALEILGDEFGCDPEYQRILAEERGIAGFEKWQESTYPNPSPGELRLLRIAWDAGQKAEREACAALITIPPYQADLVRIVKEDIRAAILARGEQEPT